ncbi:hypothetical protein QQ056_05315 [Oscillatoria laete-virens NRMC-F 0139]|nr:hypothetical protein [Oscillatoria laete-virens]MDL5052973.1 hypothetical protein [Oscillatoria laete-virens NRMC-F 0139]
MPKKNTGHFAHSQHAGQSGAAGKMPRPLKATVLGAGSGFTLWFANDLMQIPGECGGTICLVDPDTKRLALMKRLVERVAAWLGKAHWKVEATTDRRKALPGSDYIIGFIDVGGVRAMKAEYEIPKKYGVDQCIGDTIGFGGFFKAARCIPVWLEILRDIERYCPQAVVMNFTNPMSMMCLASGRVSPIPVTGLCHSVQGTGKLLAQRAGVPYGEMEWSCAGINHLAWFTKLRHKGRDLYPRLMRKAESDLRGQPADPADAGDLVRKDMMLHFGAFITESSGHLSEYLPYYRKRKDLLKKYTGKGYDGESGYLLHMLPPARKHVAKELEKRAAGKLTPGGPRTHEFSSYIIEAREKNSPMVIHGNVMNQRPGSGVKCIGNLSADACVEVACLVDRNGIQPTVYGELPEHMAALCESNIRFFSAAVNAILHRSQEEAVHALMLDPLTAACLCPAEIKKATLEIFSRNREYYRSFK